MRILIINPNSDETMSEAILHSAEAFSNGAYEVDCKTVRTAPRFIGSYEDQVEAGPGLLRLIRENEHAYDGFIVACHLDPCLSAAKEITQKPVVGIGEASMKLATFLGRRFSVIGASTKTVPLKEELIRKYYLDGQVASVRAPKQAASDLAQALTEEAALAVSQDHAEVIVLGCAGFTGLDKRIAAETGVPVLDGVICGLIVLSGILWYAMLQQTPDAAQPLM